MEENHSETIQNNINNVFERIQLAAKKTNRDPDRIELVVVTKQKSAVVVKSLSELGINHIGESYLKEALFKVELLKNYPIEWHMIGTIQPGKEKTIAAHFDVVHSVDSINTAMALSQSALDYDKTLPVYLEYNVSGEITKHGWEAWNEKQWSFLLEDLERIQELSGIKITGLMTMAPYSNNPQNARPYFQKLRRLRDFIVAELSTFEGTGLSMGMSGDFEVAIEEGATVLRIGSAIVGSR